MAEDTTKRIALNDNSFEAGGQTFIVHGHVNIERYTVLQELEVRSAYGATFVQLHRRHREWVELKNKGKGFEADVMLQNTFEGTARKVNNQYDPLLLICTLFICPKDEDRTEWNEEAANEKIKLWSKEGYPTEDFLRLGLQFSRRYQLGSEDVSLDTSAEVGQ